MHPQSFAESSAGPWKQPDLRFSSSLVLPQELYPLAFGRIHDDARNSLGCKMKPMPQPSTKRVTMMTQNFVCLEKLHFRPVPIVHTAKPVDATGMYRPVRARICPLVIDAVDVNMISGSRRMPDVRADTPRTDWKYILKLCE